MDKRFIKGLFKDTAHIDQPEGTWRYAKNAVINNKKGSLSNEGGTELAGHLGEALVTGAQNDKVLGKIEVNDNKVILFVKNVVSNTGRSEIGVWENNKYTILYNPNPPLDLNFQESNPIQGTFKIDAKGDLVVYFTDDLNPPRAFNVDRQIRESGTNVGKLYGFTPNNIELLNLFPHAGSVPHVELEDLITHQASILEGGGLLTAVYYLALAYVDDDYVATNFVTVSNPISIVEEFDFTTPTNKKDGAKEGSQTTKAIKWAITNLNTDYKYLKPVVIRKMGDATEGFKLNDIEVTTNNTTVTFSGIEGTSPASVEDVIIDTISYEKAKTIQQLDNVLYLGNLTSGQDLGFQKYANNIKLHSVTKTIENFDEYYATVDGLNTGFARSRVNEFNGAVQNVDNTKSYRYQPNIFKYKGYMRDEVYAFYIAFVMKDGSMSYAYHIPGRKPILPVETNSAGQGQAGDLWTDIGKLNPEYAKNFHFLDRVILSPGASFNQHRQMNYWENATETYPNTEDYEVYNGNTQAAPIQGEKVRHHHFPSNKNSNRKSIIGSNCETADATSVPLAQKSWDGVELTFQWDQDTDGAAQINESTWTKYRFNDDKNAPNFPVLGINGVAGPLFNPTDAINALWNRKEFTADQKMTVEVAWNVWFEQDGGTMGDVKTRLMTTSTALGSGPTEVNFDTITQFGTGNCGSTRLDFNRQTTLVTIDLEPGEKIWLETMEISSGNDHCFQANHQSTSGKSQIDCSPGLDNHYGIDCFNNSPEMNCKSWIAFSISSQAQAIPNNEYSDAKISHDVDILGIQLSDIKIPEEIANKVQGFRIYYANRNHADKTILGQSILIPSTQHNAQIGICQESNNNTDALKILNTLKNEKENFWSIDPFGKSITNYPKYPSMQIASGSTVNTITDDFGYKVFSFHDFNLLRSHNSIASATHIDLQYKVRNFAWNGPRIEQEKKMVSYIENNVSSQIDEIVQEWGWDADFNCYPQEIKSCILIGNEYSAINSREQPRLLTQKAKTYLAGDTIFEGEPLGFGSKLFNEFGESSVVFGLKDNHELPVTSAQNRLYNTTGWPHGNSFPDAGQYGVIGQGLPVLTNPLPWAGTGGGVKSQNFVANLKAFKTDVYKSIDSQDLVWTGFEVLGDDLENFVIRNNSLQGTGDTVDIVPEGIFGGDTYLCRYGVATGLKPSNPNQKSNPERAVSYHIVESSDNINFRHTQDSDSMYFPGTPARKLLEYVGIKDFSSLDNSRYNDNYSELNIIRSPFPLPLSQSLREDFPTRTHRSAKADTTSLIDNYRIFLANQFKDLPKNRGDLWTLSSFNNLIYFHMQESLFAAKGKQSLQMKDGSESFVGSGDIFQQEPDEIIQTSGGYAGTSSQWAALTTRYGYFFVDKESRKVFLMGQQLQEISAIGMEAWFKDNLKFELEDYGLKNDYDNPILGMGYTSIWDPKNRRIILTKREFKPTQAFKDGWNASVLSLPCQSYADGLIRYNSNKKVYQIWGQTMSSGPTNCAWTDLEFSCTSGYFDCVGWTISYTPEANTWTSFHDYIPYIYFNTSTDFYSLTDKYARPVVAATSGTTYGNAGIWKHNSETNRGILYQENTANTMLNNDWINLVNYYLFEVEFIHNEVKSTDTLISNLSYTLETFNQSNISVLEHGFTDFLLYNTMQVSGTTELEYMINTRRVGNSWTINKFRDMAALSTSTDTYYMSANTNLLGGTNTGTVTTSDTNNMFNVDGMSETVNTSYIDLNKSWDKQRKFTDKWVGIRLICDNKQNNLLNLYSTSVGARKVHR